MPGVSLDPLKCWTAQFTGPSGRLAWLLCESVEGLPTLLQPADHARLVLTIAHWVHYLIILKLLYCKLVHL